MFPANRQVITRDQLRRVGLTLDEYNELVNNGDVIMAEQAARDAALISGLKGLRSLSITLPKFDGSLYVDDWLNDFDKYSVEIDRTSDANKLYDLVSHLSGEAMQWYRLQTPATRDNYADLRASFKERYSPSQQEQFEVRGKIYSLKQGPLQKFIDFAREVQLKARAINVPEAEIVGICIHGARPTIKSHLAMAKPDTMAALLKCPVVVSEPDNEDSITTMFQALNSRFDGLEASVNQVQHHAERKQVSFAARQPSRSPSPAAYRGTGRSRQYSPAPRQAGPRQPQRPARRTPWPQPAPWQQPATPWQKPAPPQRFQARPPPRRPQQYSNQSCGRCGMTTCLGADGCLAYGQRCFRCQGIGHFKKMCRSRVNIVNWQPNNMPYQ